MLFGGNRLDQPLHAVGEAFLSEGRAGLDGPSAVRDLLELQGLHHLVRLKGELQILFVGIDEQGHLLEVLLAKEGSELFSALLESHVIRRVDDVNETVSVLEVVLPVGTDFALTTDIPHIQLETVLGLKTNLRRLKSRFSNFELSVLSKPKTYQGLDVETLSGHDCVNVLL